MLFTACSEDSFLSDNMTEEQRQLIGKAVNFDASISNEFTTRTTWNSNGVFNEDDMMVIYRQYTLPNGTWDPTTEAYRVYGYKSTVASGTGIVLNTKWKPIPKKFGSNSPTEAPFEQAESDSLTWENGHMVRYRAWALSNLSGALNPPSYNGNWSSYYPDFTISNWVTASGPTMQIPLTLRHITCRIGFSNFAGNQFYKIELSTDPADYAWADNSVSADEDNADKFPKEVIINGETVTITAEQAAANVKAVYDRMCMPGGVDLDAAALLAMSKDYYNTTAHPNTGSIERDGNLMIKMGTKTPAEIESDAVRPVFNNNNGNQYMISIPYDMSNAATMGEVLVLPSYTRFRIYLRDVNNGDGNNTSGYEGKYHIVSLSDLKRTDKNGNQISPKDELFKDGLPLTAGYSYIFTVGYHYNSLKIETVNKDKLNWDPEELEDGNFSSDDIPQNPSDNPYQWWKDGINDGIKKATSGSGNYEPEFHITNENEFLEFIKLVNGTAPGKTTGIERVERKDEDGKDIINPDNGTKYWWHYTDNRKLNAEGEIDWIVGEEKRKQAEEEGYIFYNRYYPSDGDRPAYSIEEILTEPFSFCDSQFNNRSFYVYLDCDLDLKDWKLLKSIGIYDKDNSANSKPFKGYFDGCPKQVVVKNSDGKKVYDDAGRLTFTDNTDCHKIKNIYMNKGYLFDNAEDAYISNISIETTHPLCIVNQGKNTSILGVSLKAPSKGASIAENLQNDGNKASYVVGCIHVGNATKALVHQANNLFMYGCMQTAYDLTEGEGALIGTETSDNKYAPQKNKKQLTWGRFMCNYYDTQHSPSAHAVGSAADTYAPQEYIRGSWTHILCAREDNLLDKADYYESLSDNRKKEIYGVAPWKAMNYGIFKYNTEVGKDAHPCNAHYEVSSVGYDYQYPQLKSVQPTSTQYLNVLNQNN